MNENGFIVSTTTDIDEIVDNCQLIVTCTASESPLIKSLNKGTHVTAIGSDTVLKQ